MTRRRSTFFFALMTCLGFLLLFLSVRIYIVYFANHAERFIFSEIAAGFLEDTVAAASLGLLTLFLLELGRTAAWIVLFPLKLIAVIVCYANLQYVNFFGERLRLFDFEYVRNIGSTWNTTLFNNLWMRKGELLFLIIPLSAVFCEFGLIVKKKPEKTRAKTFWIFSSAMLTVFLISVLGRAALGNKTALNDYHQSNPLIGLIRDAPRLGTHMKTIREIKAARPILRNKDGPGTEFSTPAGTDSYFPLPIPAGYARYDAGYPFIKIPLKDAQRMGLVRHHDAIGPFLKSIEKRKPAPNIVFLFLESLRCKEIGFFGGSYSLTPYFDSLASKSTVFKNFYGHYDMTAGAEFSALSSFYDVFKGVTAMRRHANAALFSLPEILSIFGYSNYWINSWSADFDNSRNFFELHGKFSIVDRALFPKTAKKAGWSYCDEEIMKMAVTMMDTAKKPFFAAVLTATNHLPYDVPGKEFELGLESGIYGKYLNTFHYTDYALGRFFEMIHSKDYFKNTLFFIFADTGNNRKKTEKKFDYFEYVQDEFHIPFLIYDPSREEGRVVEDLAGQVDIAPTVLDMLGIQIANHFVGESLIGQRTAPYYLAYHGRDVPWVTYIDNSRLCRYNFDTGFFSVLDRNEGNRLKIDPGERRNIISNIRGLLSLGDWAIYNDRIWDRKIEHYYRNLYKRD